MGWVTGNPKTLSADIFFDLTSKSSSTKISSETYCWSSAICFLRESVQGFNEWVRHPIKIRGQRNKTSKTKWYLFVYYSGLLQCLFDRIYHPHKSTSKKIWLFTWKNSIYYQCEMINIKSFFSLNSFWMRNI